MRKYLLITGIALTVFTACNNTSNTNNDNRKDSIYDKIDSTEAIYNDKEFLEAKKLQNKVTIAIQADLETQIMNSPKSDVADDPAFWINQDNINESRILGTNKYNGFHVYNLDGEELFHYKMGKTNNIDVRYGMQLGDKKLDLVACTNREINGISLLTIDPKIGFTTDIKETQLTVDTAKMDDIYGFCMYKSPKTGKIYAIANAKNGLVQQYEIKDNNGKPVLELVRELQIASQPEGMVADDEKAILYIGEEAKGVWKFGAEPEDAAEGELIFDANSLETAVPDIEGISLYYAAQGKGYLIISSQGNFTYIILDRQTHEYIASFKVTDGEKIDGIEETDGLDVINIPFGDKFPNGVFIAQDGFNFKKGSNKSTQNFKLVGWDKIAKAISPELIIDTKHSFIK